MKYLLLILLFILSSNLSAQRTWELVKSRIGLEEIEAIMCYDSTNCFAFSDGSFLASYFKTEDQGETWYNIYEKDFLIRGVLNEFGKEISREKISYNTLERC